MDEPRDWRAELQVIVDMMRDLSRLSEPQEAATMYGNRLRSTGLLRSDAWMAISRRNLSFPNVKITRNSTWAKQPDPWKEWDQLPQISAGILTELSYANEPVIIEDLPAKLSPSDPAYEYLKGYQFLATMPQFDNGDALNVTVLLLHDPTTFSFERYPVLVWQSNLWGRAINNLVLRKQLELAQVETRKLNVALNQELETVGEVQRSLLPKKFPVIPGVEFAAHYATSQRAGGDYYDLFVCGDGWLGLLVADVSGHGASAAVVMALTHAIAHLHPGRGTPPSELLSFVNRTLCEHYTPTIGKFVTAFYATYETSSRKMTYALAGHPSPRLVKKDRIESLRGEPGLPLGIVDEETYVDTTIQLDVGDSLVVYTDGITESRNAAGDLMGVELLDQSLQGAKDGPAELIRRILLATDEFSAGRAPDDDRTIVVMKILNH